MLRGLADLLDRELRLAVELLGHLDGRVRRFLPGSTSVSSSGTRSFKDGSGAFLDHPPFELRGGSSQNHASGPYRIFPHDSGRYPHKATRDLKVEATLRSTWIQVSLEGGDEA